MWFITVVTKARQWTHEFSLRLHKLKKKIFLKRFKVYGEQHYNSSSRRYSDEKCVLRISECVVGAFHDAPLKFLVEEAGWNSAGNGLFHILILCHIYSFPLSLSDFHLILPHSFPPFSLSYYIFLFLTHNISIVIVALSTLKRKCKAVYGAKKKRKTRDVTTK